MFLQNFRKTVISASKWKLLHIYGCFHTCLCYFSPADTTDEKYVELKFQ